MYTPRVMPNELDLGEQMYPGHDEGNEVEGNWLIT
jgi:hypothetical protein